jgi:hypothetical protein
VTNIFELVPADMLEYSKVMKCYTVFSDEQIEKMINNCIMAGVSPEESYLYITEVAKAKILDILLDRYMNGFLDVKYNEESNELIFEPVYDK